MAHTNNTSNYELSQFVGTDKPTFLGDYNGDMQKIDAAIKGAKDTADGASTTADAASALATSASATATQAATDAASASANATTALNTANGATTTANSAMSTATSAATAASDATTTANAAATEAAAATAAVALKPSYDETFARMFSMTSSTATITAPTGFTPTSGGVVYSAKNADTSLGKLYGAVVLTRDSSGGTGFITVATIAAGFGTRSQSFTIKGFTGTIQRTSGQQTGIDCALIVNTNGTVDIQCSVTSDTTQIIVNFPPCLLVLSDFGD